MFHAVPKHSGEPRRTIGTLPREALTSLTVRNGRRWNSPFAKDAYDLVVQGSGLSIMDELSEREEKLLNDIDGEFHS